ncbi:MAG TPA: VOC family protein [Pseudonocardiaceae bacterium]|nr:VOC family protein [Pseudonocardiaceae bacterium]
MAHQLGPTPDGYSTVTPWIVTRNTVALIEFIKEAFDAEELGRVEVSEGVLGHADARIGDSMVMMFDSPFPVETPSLLHVYVADADAVVRRAVEAGAVVVTEPTELLWENKVDKVGRVRDPLGNIWWIQERIAEITPEQVAERAGDPKYAKAMAYLATTLASALK